MVIIEKEKDIVFLIEKAIDKLKVVKDYAEKENKQIVSDLAKGLEGIIPINAICTEIISRLDGYLSPRTIRKYLDEKYKIKTRVDNARKQKKSNQSSLAASGPLNKVSDTVVIDRRDKISFQDVNNQQTNQPSEVYVGEDNDSIQSLSHNESLSSTEQDPSPGQDNIEITKCLRCIDKEERINELEGALQKVQQFTTADKIGPSTVETERFAEVHEEPLEFEVSKCGWEIRDYIRSSKIRSYDEKIWFNGRIDPNTGKVINFDLGRLDQLPQKSVPNRGLD